MSRKIKLKKHVKIYLIFICIGLIVGIICFNIVRKSNVVFIDDSKEIDLIVGEAVAVQAKFIEQENNDIIFCTDDSDILSIDSNGQIIAKKRGITYIYAGTRDREKQAKKRIVINNDVSSDYYNRIHIEEEVNSILEVGAKYIIVSKPDDLFKNYKILYSSSDSNIIDVDSVGNIRAKEAGKAQISLKIENTDIEKKLEFESKDNYVHIKKISIHADSLLESGQQMDLKISVYPDNANNQDFIYSSSEPTIASINEKGIVKGLRPGLATLTVVSLDNKTKATHKIFVSKTSGYLTNDMLSAVGIDECDKLMIVAHPDDETLWGGGHLLRDKYFVLCLTNQFNQIRKNEFYKAMEFSGNKGIILSYPDLNDKDKSNWEHNKIGVRKDVDRVIEYKKWNTIVTHSPAGETGHRHHKFTSQIVTKSAKDHNFINKLMYFGKFYEKGEVPKSLTPTLTLDEINKKTEMLAIYKAEKKSIDAFWRQMIPYEYWKKAKDWKKEKL